MSGTLLTPVIMREFTNNAKVASGAQLFFSESGNDIGKAVYSDLACTIPRTNPVICDASGWPGAIYGLGLYRIRVSDHNGVQIVAPVDGLGSGGGEDPSSSIGYTFVGTYADIRALSGNVTVAYCIGRNTPGDGGEGLFELVPGSTLTDDDGTILTNTSGSMVWRRIVDGFLDPRWYGVTYNALVTQNTYVTVALRASAALKIPLRVNGKVYITSNVTVPQYASVCGTGSFVSGTSIRVTFASGSNLLPGTTSLFGQNITASIDPSAAQNINVTLFADISDDDVLTKFLASPAGSEQLLVVDRTLNVASQTISTDNPITFANQAKISATGSGAMGISMPNIVLPAVPYQIFDFVRTNTSYTMDFGSTYMAPDWFGTESSDWWFEIKLASLGGHLLLSEGKSYTVYTAMGTFPNLSIHGKGILNLYVNLDVTNTLDINDAHVYNYYNGLGSSRTITADYANNKLALDRAFAPIKTGDVFKIYNSTTLVTTITATADSDGSYIEVTGITLPSATGKTAVYSEYAAANVQYWTSPALVTGHSATISARINAAVSNIIGFNLYEVGENGAYAKPFLYSPCLPEMKSAAFLYTDPNGYIEPGSNRIDLIQGTDFTINLHNLYAFSPSYTAGISIIPITSRLGMINLQIWWDYSPGGWIPEPDNNNNSCPIYVTPLTPSASKWIAGNNKFFAGVCDLAECWTNGVANTTTSFPVNIPQGVIGKGTGEFYFTGGTPQTQARGTGADLIFGTPDPTADLSISAHGPCMTWYDIFRNRGPLQQGIYSRIGFSGLIFIPS
jgi:hypothetical protein